MYILIYIYIHTLIHIYIHTHKNSTKLIERPSEVPCAGGWTAPSVAMIPIGLAKRVMALPVILLRMLCAGVCEKRSM